MRYLLFFIIAVPAAEIGLLMVSGKLFGVWLTVMLIILTGILGAYLAKREGLQALRTVQTQLQNGQMPGDAVLDGICILIGGTLLLTPGFISDITGFLMLFPPTRKFIKRYMLRIIKKRITNGNIKIIK
ncbi:FxsA family protein [Neobacillus dielmonensis]|uniref:FxsA family protein n=1 Tax=Neobacillus dielmonensis TaxID=1347369 RepID=UPI0005A71122|nr:FxsA family protein [Neobacillus dielmonensis]